MNTQDILGIVAIVASLLSIGISIWFSIISNKHNKEVSEIQASIKTEIDNFKSVYSAHTENLTEILKIHTEKDKEIIMKSFKNGK
jgi:hypothetical protein